MALNMYANVQGLQNCLLVKYNDNIKKSRKGTYYKYFKFEVKKNNVHVSI